MSGCCCGSTKGEQETGALRDQGAVGNAQRVSATLSLRDRLDTLRVRWAIGRMSYRVAPGLYAVGNPTAESVVLVSANFKLSFDKLRSSLVGRDAWILVLDTKGINVWCAAGKGTFSTQEIVRRVLGTGLGLVVSHRKLIVPQLGAPGVSAHEVRRLCGFTVVYGPVRAADLPAFLDARMKATPEMRQVRFDLRDRAVLVPVELMMGLKYALLIAAGFLVAGGLSAKGYSLADVLSVGFASAALAFGGYMTATVLGPILLPWLPGRAFSMKGAVLGVLLFAVLASWNAFVSPVFGSWLHATAWMFIVPAIASFIVMSFTGASTFTSLSGVLYEMRFAVPAQISAGVIGLAFWFSGLFLGR